MSTYAVLALLSENGPWVLLDLFDDEPRAHAYASEIKTRNPMWRVYVIGGFQEEIKL
jgi:hypothetical protein